jgi:acyl-CoA synthetase
VTNTVLTLLSTAQANGFTAAGHWTDATIYSLTRVHATTMPGKVAVRERAREVTYRALVDAADRLASALDDSGVRPGQRVAAWMPSRIETAVILLACSRNGYVCAPSLHRDHTVGEVTDLLRHMRASALIAQKGYGADAGRHDIFEAAADLGTLRAVIGLEPADRSSARVLAEIGTTARTVDVRTDPNTVVYLAYTSGTTGTPKGVMHSDNTVLAPVRALAADWSLDQRAVVYSFSPLSHSLGFGAMVLALTSGGELVVHDLPRGASPVERLRETNATLAVGVPTHAIDVLAELRTSSSAGLPALQGFRISGAAVAPFVTEGLLQHGVVPMSGYGMTEAGSTHYTLPDDSPQRITETSGKACAGYEVRIFSLNDPYEEMPAGEVGQICTRGASLMLGYFDDQAATEASFNSHGWFMTGDLGWMDDAGYIRITGREKDIIIRGGHNIFPSRIENLAMRHDAVVRAAAVPVADPRLGEKVCLAVTVKPGRRVGPEEMLQHLDAMGLSKFDMPEYFLQVADLPLLPSGKVAKRTLVSWIDEGRVTSLPIRFRPRV